jgi:hypothetical protein
MSKGSAFFQLQFWIRAARSVLGEFSYTPPPWCIQAGRSTFDSMQRRPEVWVGAIVAAGVLSVAGLQGWQWWDAHRAHLRQFTESREITSALTSPGVTPVIKGKAEPQDISIHFSGATAPLASIGKAVASGVALSPEACTGSWKWQDEKTLVFEPTTDWPAGTEYEVTLDASAVPKEAILKQREVDSSPHPRSRPSWRAWSFTPTRRILRFTRSLPKSL